MVRREEQTEHVFKGSASFSVCVRVCVCVCVCVRVCVYITYGCGMCLVSYGVSPCVYVCLVVSYGVCVYGYVSGKCV